MENCNIIISTVFELFSIVLISYYFWGMKTTENKWNIFKCIVVSILFFLLKYFNYINEGYLLFYEIIVICLLFSESLLKKVQVFIINEVSLLIIEIIMDSARIICINFKGKQLYDNSRWDLEKTIIEFIIVLLLCIILYKRRNELYKYTRKISVAMQIYAIFTAVLSITIIVISRLSLDKEINIFGKLTLSISMLLIAILILIIWGVVQVLLVSKRELEESKKENEKCLQMQQEYYIKLYESNQNIRAFKHDYKSHVLVINELLQEQKYDDAKMYLEKLIKKKESFHSFTTGNVTIDALVNATYEEAIKSKIIFEVIGRITGDLPISEVEVCTLLSNALNNALEANMLIGGKRYIYVELKNDFERIYITIKNSAKATKNNNEVLGTSKSDLENHGFGMKNMEKVVNSCGGRMIWIYKDSIFEMNFILPRKASSLQNNKSSK